MPGQQATRPTSARSLTISPPEVDTQRVLLVEVDLLHVAPEENASYKTTRDLWT